MSNKKTSNSMDGVVKSFTIILALLVAASLASGVSGGAINPAMAFGCNFMSWLLKGNGDAVVNLWAYIVGPLVGGALSALFYNLYHCGAVECCKGDDGTGT